MSGSPTRRSRILPAILFVECVALLALGLHAMLAGRGMPRVVVFTGGGPGNPFAEYIRLGAETAARNTGCRIETMASGWDLELMLRQLRQVIASRPAAICLLGHPGEDALGSLVSEARNAGILVTGYNVDLPLLRERYRDDGFGYVGNDLTAAGRQLGRACLQRLALKPGDGAVVFSPTIGQASLRGQRSEGVAEALRQGGLGVTVETLGPGLWGDDPATLTDYLTGLHARHPRVRLVVADAPNLAMSCLPTLDAWRRDHPLDLVCFDLTPGVAEALRSGRIALVADQQPFLQGYLPVLQVMSSLRHGATGMEIDTGCAILDAAAAAELMPLINRGIR